MSWFSPASPRSPRLERAAPAFSLESYRPPRPLIHAIIVNVVCAIGCGASTVSMTILSHAYAVHTIALVSNSMLLFLFGAACAVVAIAMDYCARALYAREARAGGRGFGAAETADCSALALAVASIGVFCWSATATYAAVYGGAAPLA